MKGKMSEGKTISAFLNHFTINYFAFMASTSHSH